MRGPRGLGRLSLRSGEGVLPRDFGAEGKTYKETRLICDAVEMGEKNTASVRPKPHSARPLGH